MECENVLTIDNREDFRSWLSQNCETAKECYVEARRGRPDGNGLWYLDAVEEALCFGWIDSTVRVIDGRRMQRFGPRRKDGNWTELNKERVRRLEKLGFMTDAGRRVLPPLGPRSFSFPPEVVSELKRARVWSKFRELPPLYQRVRASNLEFYRTRDSEAYARMLTHTIEATGAGETFGEWNDYGRLTDY